MPLGQSPKRAAVTLRNADRGRRLVGPLPPDLERWSDRQQLADALAAIAAPVEPSPQQPRKP
jgi:hypothetical protein